MVVKVNKSVEYLLHLVCVYFNNILTFSTCSPFVSDMELKYAKPWPNISLSNL